MRRGIPRCPFRTMPVRGPGDPTTGTRPPPLGCLHVGLANRRARYWDEQTRGRATGRDLSEGTETSRVISMDSHAAQPENRFLALLESPRDRPAIIAHRGDSFHAPENTLEAARLGWEAGAEAWEFDVQLTRDGVPVVL